MVSSGTNPRSYTTHWFHGADGTRLAYQVLGEGPPIILSNGLGGTFHTWRHLYGHLAKRFRIVSWDYRGLHGSDAPIDPSQVTVRHQVDDLEGLLDELGLGEAVFLGWSLGVQVNFELYRRRPQSFLGLGVINGTAGLPFETLPAARVLKHVTPVLLREMARRGKYLSKAARVATTWPGFIGLLKRTGIIAPSLDEQVFRELAVEFGRLDFSLYLDTLRRAGEHDAWDVLPHITTPTTIITGERDPMTPVRAATRMSELIPEARLVVVPGCTHYTPLEKPQVVNQAIDNLLARSGYL